MIQATTVSLLRGAQLPRLGLGTWPMDDAEAEHAVAAAIGAGYRLIDTAENYENERGVGRGIAASGIDRSDIFITTKFNKKWHGEDLVVEAFEASAERLGVDYIDMLMIHWPNPGEDRYVGAFQGLLRLADQGRIRAIGTSNFKPENLERLHSETGQFPEVNQIQLSPETTRPEARRYHAEHGIVTQSWRPLAGPRSALLTLPVVTDLATRHDRTPAQIILRWHLHLGLQAVPKSSNLQRMTENIDIFDFSLTADDIAVLSGLDQGESAATDSDTFGH